MKILISGASGLLGKALMAHLALEGHEVAALKRSQNCAESPSWNPAEGELNLGDWQDCEAVIHLSGENIAGSLWTEKNKKRFLDSRVNTSSLLAQHFANADHKPKVIISASGVSYYGDCGDDEISEEQRKGDGFLAYICDEWEKSWQAASQAGIRCAFMRLGIVLSAEGGALEKMLPPFRLGLGGRLGSGRQYMPWIALEDVVGAVGFILKNESLVGPVNFAAPNSVRNNTFTKSLGRVLKRPTFLPVPEFFVKNIIGEMGREMFLPSLNVIPQKLLDAGYQFHYSELDACFEDLFGK